MANEIRCPQCGADFGTDRGENMFGELVTECGHCATVYETRKPDTDLREEAVEKAIVPFLVIACPRCGSVDTFVNGTDRPVRYHRCRGCNRPFQSLECVYDPDKHGLLFR